MDNKKTPDPIIFGTDAFNNWDSRIRTYRCWNQNPVPYHLAISHCVACQSLTTMAIIQYDK